MNETVNPVSLKPAAAPPPTAASLPAPSRAVASQQPVAYVDMVDEHDPVAEIREATLTPLASNEVKATFAEFAAKANATVAATPATEAMSDELKTLRRMLENQLAHLAWNDLTRRAPVHTEKTQRAPAACRRIQPSTSASSINACCPMPPGSRSAAASGRPRTCRS